MSPLFPMNIFASSSRNRAKDFSIVSACIWAGRFPHDNGHVGHKTLAPKFHVDPDQVLLFIVTTIGVGIHKRIKHTMVVIGGRKRAGQSHVPSNTCVITCVLAVLFLRVTMYLVPVDSDLEGHHTFCTGTFVFTSRSLIIPVLYGMPMQCGTGTVHCIL